MTLLTVVQSVCQVVGVTSPTSIFSGITGNRTMQEMLDLANEMAQRIATDTREWTKLKKIHTLTGDGIKTAFDLPANYKRMLLSANVWRSTSATQPMTFVPDTDEWMQRRAQGYYSAWGEWTMLGGQMLIEPVMGAGITATFAYLDKNCIQLASGGFGDAFIADGDGFLLGDRLLKLGMVFQWKAQKGTPYTEDMATYGDALTVAMGSDQPAPIFVGHLPISRNTKVAYPFPVPT
jgi:hypothetical protein